MTDEEIETIIDELLDADTLKAWGPQAGFLLALELGLVDGDVVDVDANGQVVVSTSADKIKRNIAAARAAKAAGRTMAKHFG